jgi:hypothetical protein
MGKCDFETYLKLLKIWHSRKASNALPLGSTAAIPCPSFPYNHANYGATLSEINLGLGTFSPFIAL